MRPGFVAEGWLVWPTDRRERLLRLLVIVALLLGVAERVAWVAGHGLVQTRAVGEALEVARAFAENFSLSNAYKPGQGPTAHVMPTTPVFAGLIYRGFGFASPVSEAILFACATALTFVSFGLGYRLMAEVGSPRAARILGLVLLALLPLNMDAEAKSFRVWEGGLATACGLGYLLLLIRFDKAGRTGLGATALLAFAAAILLFISPPLGVAGYLCTLIVMVKRQPARFWLRSGAIAVLALIMVLTPWTVRNALVFGHFVPLRSNFGLELAIGMNPEAVNTTDPGATFRKRMAEVHPFTSDSAYARMQAAGGEVEYAKKLQTDTWAWMREHPAQASQLALRHAREYFLPSVWLWRIPAWHGFTGSGGPQILATWGLAVLGLLGAAAATFRGWRWRYPVIILMTPMLVYMLTQPILRYRYLGYSLLVYFATDLVVRVGAGLWRYAAMQRSGPSSHSVPQPV